MLHRLRWEVSAVTSADFLEPLLGRLPLGAYLGDRPAALEHLRRQAQTYVIMCGTGEYTDAELKPLLRRHIQGSRRRQGYSFGAEADAVAVTETS